MEWRSCLSGDSLYYDRNRGYGLAIKNVAILDTLNDCIISGHWAEYFERQLYHCRKYFADTHHA